MSATDELVLLIVGMTLSHSPGSKWWPNVEPVLPTEPKPDYCTNRNPKR